MKEYLLYLLFVVTAFGLIALDQWIERKDKETDTFDGADEDYKCCYTCGHWAMLPAAKYDPEGVCEVKSNGDVEIIMQWNGCCNEYTDVQRGDKDEHHIDTLP